MARILIALFTDRESEAPRGSHTALVCERAGDRLRSLRRLFWLKGEQKSFRATRVGVGYM